jgi:hypothetical protein
MSAYKVIECKVKNPEHIVAGLIDMGIPRNQIEVHENPVSLYNYSGRKTGQKANVVVRRENFKKYTKASYNADLGFEKVQDGYRTHINSEEHRWWKKHEPRFQQVAATMKVTEEARKHGYHIKKVEKEGNIRLRLVKNY